MFLGDFPLDSKKARSFILESNSSDVSSFNEIYRSESADIGNLVCHYPDHLYFIKNTSQPGEIDKTYEAASLQFKNKNIKIMTEIKRAYHLVQMEELLLLPHLGKYYILRGGYQTNQDSLGQ